MQTTQPHKETVLNWRKIRTISNRPTSEAEPLTKLYDEEICKLRIQNSNDDTTNTVEQLPTIPSVKSSLFQARRK